jgi:formylglycine-generating enzyme required for sulfatase activity
MESYQVGERMTDPKSISMVYVPTGNFLMGSTERQVEDAYQQAKKENNDADKEWFTPEMPQHEQVIQTAFWLDLAPVTNAGYARFMQEGGYSTREFWSKGGWKWLKDNQKPVPQDYPDVSSAPDQPRVGVTWFEAYAYCQWRGGRLPTEAEWEWAARGPESRIYPWGNDFVSDDMIWEKTSGGRTAPGGEGIRTAGASWIGALDMSGNVWEWCNSVYKPYPYTPADGRESNSDDSNARVLRGGSWRNGLTSDLRAACRIGRSPAAVFDLAGFRCAGSSD